MAGQHPSGDTYGLFDADSALLIDRKRMICRLDLNRGNACGSIEAHARL
jgi:hypothetical protein